MPETPTKTRQALLAAEKGWIAPRGGNLRIALVYPNSYHIGMSSLGFQLAWRVINDHPLASAERFFTDTLDFGSIETGAPLSRFDVIAFSASYEMDDPNIVDVIEAAGFPVLARERRGGQYPLILMGGVLVSVNRLPLYPFLDGFLHGDAEVALPPILDALSAVPDRESDLARRRLESIDGLPGVELTPGARLAAGLSPERGTELGADIPSDSREDAALPRPRPPEAPRLNDLNNPLCATQILTPNTEFSNMALLDLARGCPHHCTFCWIGHNTPPYRQRSIETLIAAAEAWSPMTDRFGLVSSAVGAHTGIDEICRWMMSRGLKVSYSSLRVEEVTPTMLEALARGGQRTITIAPEAGNVRVRRLLGKKISDEEILDVVGRAMSLGTENIKLYYMLGIPSETDEEALDIARFSERVRAVMLQHSRARGRIGYLGLNLGVFVPKPNLPLNHIEPVPLAAVKSRLRKVVQALRRIPNTRLNVSSPDLALAQMTLSTGGIEASRYIQLVRRLGGDWRRANREWREEAGVQFNQRRGQSRLSGEKLRLRAGAAIAP